MGKLATAERVSRDASDNFVFQRSLLAYDRAAEIVSGDVLEIGTGTGYGIELVAPHCDRFVTVDKYAAAGDRHAANVEFRRMCVPPLGFGDESFDFVITFQVIEHIDRLCPRAKGIEYYRSVKGLGREITEFPCRECGSDHQEQAAVRPAHQVPARCRHVGGGRTQSGLRYSFHIALTR